MVFSQLFMRVSLFLAPLIIDGNFNYPGYDPKFEPQVGGPFEIVAGVGMISIMLFILGTFLVKKLFVRRMFAVAIIVDALICAVLYPINQIASKAGLAVAVMGIMVASIAYGIVFLIFSIKKKKHLDELRARAESVENPYDRAMPRKFDD